MSPISKVNRFFNIILTPITYDAIMQIPYKSVYTEQYVDLFGLCMKGSSLFSASNYMHIPYNSLICI